ncbi:MAG: hypothetical protein R3C24_10270 [Cyanobacteriota/Melainabacteria group bacterium]|nr:hypothetical protein [Cyanobacteria bacterium HKST-UBA01]MCB9469368.1 hypothetical protein [Candidatus Obscuribacterales bacterium]
MAKNMKAMKGKKSQRAMRGMGAVQGRAVKRAKGQQLPVNENPSNEKWDKLGYAMFGSLLVIGVLTAAFAVYYSSNRFLEALSASPIDWLTCVFMTLLLAGGFFAARAFVSLAFFGTVMLCSKFGAWKTTEAICGLAIKYRFLVPNGGSWASMALVQSLISRGLFTESIEIAEKEWERSGANEKQALNLGPMCAAAGMAQQVEGNRKQTAVWNERAIESLTKMLENAESDKKGIFAWAARSQAGSWVGQVKMQLAAAHFSNANVHMETMDYRRAKASYKSACDYAVQSPEFPQKEDIIMMSKEQLQRLKHA